MLRLLFLWSAMLIAVFGQSPREQASALVDAGVELSHRGNFQAAAEKFLQAISLDPRLAEAHYLLGLVRQQDGRNDAALASFQAALKVDPNYPEPQARVCELLTRAARAKESGFEAARAACRKAALLNPRDAEPHVHLGFISASQGAAAVAAQEYQTALKLDPKLPVKFDLAMAYADSQQTSKAVPLLREVVTADPANAAARFQLGSALAKQGDCAAAIPLLQTGAEAAQRYYVLAGCLKKAGRDAEASAAIEKVRELRGGADSAMQAKYRAAIAQKYLDGGEFDKAVEEYREALKLQPDLATKVDLAVALLRAGKPAEVPPLLANLTDALARYQLALAYAQLNRPADSAQTLRLAVASKPNFAEAWYQLGVVLAASGKPAEAEPALRKACALRADEPAFRRAWAEVLRKLGRTAEADQQLKIAAAAAK